MAVLFVEIVNLSDGCLVIATKRDLATSPLPVGKKCAELNPALTSGIVDAFVEFGCDAVGAVELDSFKGFIHCGINLSFDATIFLRCFDAPAVPPITHG